MPKLIAKTFCNRDNVAKTATAPAMATEREPDFKQAIAINIKQSAVLKVMSAMPGIQRVSVA
ncbi:MAG: hypothetical protein R8K50_11385 [Mariprofundus sp.]